MQDFITTKIIINNISRRMQDFVITITKIIINNISAVVLFFIGIVHPVRM